MIALQVRDLYAGYGKIPILDRVSLQIAGGEAVAVVGPNGAGKSTLLKAITGLIRPDSGEILFDGRNLSGWASYNIARTGISYVPEGGRLFPNMTERENLFMGAFAAPANLKSGALEDVYTLFPILEKRGRQLARTLSGGEKQMLAISRGLVSRPKLLLLDEPSLGIAPKLVEEIYERLHMMKDKGLTVLLVEQNINFALELADRAYVLENGRVVLDGSGPEVAANPGIRKHFLGL